MLQVILCDKCASDSVKYTVKHTEYVATCEVCKHLKKRTYRNYFCSRKCMIEFYEQEKLNEKKTKVENES